VSVNRDDEDWTDNHCFTKDVDFEKPVAVCMGCGFPLKRGEIGCVVEGTMTDYHRQTDYPVTLTYCFECRHGLYQFGKETIETALARSKKLADMDDEDKHYSKTHTAEECFERLKQIAEGELNEN
jgi:hypothetical protein